MSSRSTVPGGKPAASAVKTPTTPSSTQGNHQPNMMVPHEKIAMRAYEKWCQRGCPPGSEQQDWLEAETELKAEMARATKQGR